MVTWKTLAQVEDGYVFPGMRQDVKAAFKTYAICVVNSRQQL